MLHFLFIVHQEKYNIDYCYCYYNQASVHPPALQIGNYADMCCSERKRHLVCSATQWRTVQLALESTRFPGSFLEQKL